MQAWKCKVLVKRLVGLKELDYDDRKDHPWGEHWRWLYQDTMPTEDEILDDFHNHVAIACLDHFWIQVISVILQKGVTQ